jgi:hypothetical protein
MAQLQEQAHAAYRSWIAALAAFQLLHVTALITMGLWLLPGLSPELSAATRVEYIQAHIWQWRLGWLPWQLCAASDLWLSVALFRWARSFREPRASRWAMAALLCLVVAIVPEQYAETRPVGPFVSTPVDLFRSELALAMWLTGTWANIAYTLMTACWLRCLHALPKRSGAELGGVFDGVVLLAFLLAGMANHSAWSPSDGGENAHAFQIASLFNAVAFPGLFLIGLRMAMVAGEAQLHALVPPNASHTSMWQQAVCSPGLRDLLRAMLFWMPFPTLRSDVQDVVYVNWLVPADALQTCVGSELRIERYGDRALLSALLFRHGHFGPKFLGPLRKLLPSPIQCNVRAYLSTPARHVAFVANWVDHALYFAGARLLSDGLPVQLGAARHVRNTSALEVFAGASDGRASLHVQLEACGDQVLPDAFKPIFSSWSSLVAYVLPQDAARRTLPTIGCIAATAIEVVAPLSAAVPVNLKSVFVGDPVLAELTSNAPACAFLVPTMTFTVHGERLLEH